MNRKYYSVAWKRYRNEILTENMNVFMTILGILIVFGLVYKYFLKKKTKPAGHRRKQNRKEGLPDETVILQGQMEICVLYRKSSFGRIL